MKEKCCLPKCGREKHSKKHGLCHTHYIRYLKHGDPGAGYIKKRISHPPFQLIKNTDK